MNIKKVLEGVTGKDVEELEILGVVSDSRKVQPGFLFVAYDGVEVDGHQYIDKAIKNGAVAIVGEKEMMLDKPYFKVENGRLAWAKMLANFYGNPEKKLKIIGVTGTDGKTTTTNLIYEFLKTSGEKVGMVSTIKAVIGGVELDTGLHTSSPDPDVLWPWLSQMVETGQTHLVLETTSHGLSQYRLGGIKFEIGVLTNFAHDHLEFHKTIENYRNAKAMLFEKSKVSVLNKRSGEYDYFKSSAIGEVISYDIQSEIRAVKYIEEAESVTQKFEVLLGGKWLKLETGMLGEYNLENILAAIKTVTLLGVKIETIALVLKNFGNLAGRFQIVSNNRGIRTIVDFAHTEQGMRSVVSMVRKYLAKKDEKIIVVFGCNGERDITKRRPMGRTASQLADMVVVTTEDPRRESIDEIFSQICRGCEEFGGILDKNIFRVDDRKMAIDLAVNKLAKKGDWILFLGKGHEKSMNIDGVETDWDEVSVVKEVLE